MNTTAVTLFLKKKKKVAGKETKPIMKAVQA
jgi:hypothetical protein